MNTASIIIVSLLVIMTVALLVAMYFLIYRNDKVYHFRRHIIQLCYAYNRRRIADNVSVDVFNAYTQFCDKHSYNEMVFSLKPLRLEAWFTDDEIRELMS